jgi:uncharacterized protein YerC
MCGAKPTRPLQILRREEIFLELKSLFVELSAPEEYGEIKAFVEKWHYTHAVTGVTPSHCFKIIYRPAMPYPEYKVCVWPREGVMMVGAAIFGIPGQLQTLKLYSEHGKYKTVELRRLVLLDAAPRNSESRSISFMLQLLKSSVDRVISYADPNERRPDHPDGCHTGLIYRASGFHRLEEKPKTKAIWWDYTKGPRPTWWTKERYAVRNIDQYINYREEPEGWKSIPEKEKLLRFEKEQLYGKSKPVYIIKRNAHLTRISKRLRAALDGGKAGYRSEKAKIIYVKDLRVGMQYFETPTKTKEETEEMKKIKPEQKTETLKLHSEGKTHKEISEKVGISTQSIAKIVKPQQKKPTSTVSDRDLDGYSKLRQAIAKSKRSFPEFYE